MILGLTHEQLIIVFAAAIVFRVFFVRKKGGSDVDEPSRSGLFGKLGKFGKFGKSDEDIWD